MNIAIEEVSACRRRLSIEVPAKDVEQEKSKVLDEYLKYASINGFRPGKAPRKMVERKYRKNIESEIRRSLVPKAFREAVKEKELDIVSAPKVDDLKYEPGLSLSFTTTVDLAPVFALPNYKGIKVAQGESAVTDQEVLDVINNVLEQKSDYNTIEGRPVQENDYAVITYEGTIDGKSVTEFTPETPNLGKQEKFWLWIKEDIFLPDFGKQLIGANKGDSRQVKVNFPDTFPQEPLQGKEAIYDVKVEDIKEKVLPELTDELAQEIAKMDAEELKKVVRGNLENQKEGNVRNERIQTILEELRAKTNFELPESNVEEETRNTIYDIIRQNQQQGIPDHLLEEKKQDIMTNAEKSAKDKVKTNFILKKIADQEKIEVSSEEMAQELQMLSQQYQIPPDKLYKQLEENGAILKLQDDVLRRKTLDFLLQSAEIA
ncbi:MAG: trigger factor [Verrucomicrobiota bacterium]